MMKHIFQKVSPRFGPAAGTVDGGSLLMSKFIDRVTLKAQTRELLRTAQVSPKGMTVLYCGCAFLLSLIGSLISAPELVTTFVSILTTLAGWILAAGFTLYCMDIRRRERAEYAVLFDGFSFTGKIIALNIVINLFVFLWSMLFVIPGVIAYYRYSFALYNLYENPEMDIMEALNLSKRQTQGYKMELFKLDLSYMGWILLSVLPGLIFDFMAFFAAGADPYALLTAPTPLWQFLTAAAFSYAVSIFYLPNYQCVQLAYFDIAREELSGPQQADPFDRPDGF